MANTPTTYYAINKPASGDTGWGTTMSANMDTIDTALQGMAQLAGRAGGQTLIGGTAASNSLTLRSTSNGTPGYVLLQPTGGNVGIGTAAPTATVHVQGASTDTINSDGLLVKFQGAGGNGLGFGTLLSSPYQSYIQAGYLVDITQAQYTLSLNPLGGYVGIGTTAPTQALHVNGQLFFEDSAALVDPGTGGAGMRIGFLTSGDYAYIQAHESGVVGKNIAIQPLGGNVGIGTTTPSSKFYLYDTVNREPSVTVGTTGTFDINDAGVTLAGGASGNSPYPFWLQARGVGDHAYYMSINPLGGNVGVGTLSPVSPLHVNLADYGTNAVATVLTVEHHNISGTPASGFGSRVSWLLDSSTAEDQPAAALDVAWNIATHATKTTLVKLSVYHAAAEHKWLHNSQAETADGYNQFWGISAGNTALSPSGGASLLASLNVGSGAFVLTSLTTGYNNSGFGGVCLQNVTTGYGNTAMGLGALRTLVTGNSNVAVGSNAGYYETGSNKLFIDNATRASEADGRAKALVYGIFDAAVANQEITFNVGKHGFFGQAAVAKPTGVAVTAAAIHAALVALNLIAA